MWLACVVRGVLYHVVSGDFPDRFGEGCMHYCCPLCFSLRLLCTCTMQEKALMLYSASVTSVYARTGRLRTNCFQDEAMSIYSSCFILFVERRDHVVNAYMLVRSNLESIIITDDLDRSRRSRHCWNDMAPERRNMRGVCSGMHASRGCEVAATMSL